MDHLAYYGLTQEPFSIVPLTNFYYHNDQHDQAFMRLHRSVEGMRGLAVLVGDVGTGKTLLARRLLESLSEEEYEAALLVVLHAEVTGEWLVRRIAVQMGVEDTSGGKVEVLGKLYARLNAIAEEGRKAAILIDEAHMLRSPETLEDIRGLLNLELSDSKLLSIVMFGMPELDRCLLGEPALKQRMAMRFQLKNLPKDVLVDYVRFRLFHAGSDKSVFSSAALEGIYNLSGGNPRLVNVICDNALFEGFVRRADLPLGAEIIESVASDLGLHSPEARDEVAERR
jgi:type II secretory pathway predicted ATPase ExeA